MIIESIIFAIFVCSFGGILLILAKKIHALNALPQNGSAGIRKHHLILNIENRVKEIAIAFEKQVFFHKLLSWVKVITLKVETRVDVMLQRIRKKSQEVDKKLKLKK